MAATAASSRDAVRAEAEVEVTAPAFHPADCAGVPAPRWTATRPTGTRWGTRPSTGETPLLPSLWPRVWARFRSLWPANGGGGGRRSSGPPHPGCTVQARRFSQDAHCPSQPRVAGERPVSRGELLLKAPQRSSPQKKTKGAGSPGPQGGLLVLTPN